jgi:hypothetical protein
LTGNRFDTMPSQPSLQACSKRMSPSLSKNSFRDNSRVWAAHQLYQLALTVLGEPRKSSPSSSIRSNASSRYSPTVLTTLDSGRVLLIAENLSWARTMSSYFATVVTGSLGTMCTSL